MKHYSNLRETVCKFECEETICWSVDKKRMKSPYARWERVTAEGREGWQGGGRGGRGSVERFVPSVN